VAALLGMPAVNAINHARHLSQSTTARLAYDWLLAHAPPGSRLAIEAGGLIPSGDRYVLHFHPRLVKDVAYYRRDRTDFVIASSDAFGRALYDNPQSAEAAAYRELFAELDLAVTFAPAPGRPGPELRIFRLPQTAHDTAPSGGPGR
jgi:hypothetical protein